MQRNNGWNFLNLTQYINIWNLEAEWNPNRKNPKKSTPRYMTVILPKSKDKAKDFKSSGREMTPHIWWKTIRISTYFSSGAVEPRRSDKQHLSKVERIKSIHSEFYIQWKYCSALKGK